MAKVRIGTAGWSIPRPVAGRFPSEGHGLARYAATFDAVEINSSFYRPHQPKTYERWAAITPPDFRFALKVPRAVTHEAKLACGGALLDGFLGQIAGLGGKAGPLLVQLPPSLRFDPAVAAAFVARLRRAWPGLVAWEPRHPTWFCDEAEALLVAGRIARVAADPAPHPRAAAPGGWSGLAYWRWHGSPHMYVSPYSAAALDGLAARLQASPARDTWCIFDNTASGAAAVDALALKDRIEP